MIDNYELLIRPSKIPKLDPIDIQIIISPNKVPEVRLGACVSFTPKMQFIMLGDTWERLVK